MSITSQREPTTDAVEILRRDLIGTDLQAAAEYEQARAKLMAAHEVCRLREAAGLTRAQLARRVGINRAVIGQLEGADYEGDSLAMLIR